MIPSRRVFDELAGDYDRWFDENGAVYAAQVRMLWNAVPHTGCGLEVGAGSGRFAVPLELRCGVDPSRELLKMAKSRGMEVVVGEGEHLPYRADSFDYVLMMTVICFLDDVGVVFREVHRVLRPRGILVVGFIEKERDIYRRYQHEPTKGRFLRFAEYRTVEDVTRFFGCAGFAQISVIERTEGFCVMNGRKS